MHQFRVWMAPAALAGVVLCASPALAQDTAKKADFGAFYIGTEIGVSFVPSVKIKDYTPADPSVFGISGVEAQTSPGAAWNFDIGFKLTEAFSIELEGGYYRNGFDGFSSGEFVNAGLGSTPVIGGSGNFQQIPIFLNGKFELPLTTANAGSDGGALKLELMAGFGAVNVGANISNIAAADIPGVTATVDGNSWAAGGQLGVGLAWELNTRVNLGVSYRFMMVNSADFGVATFSDPALVGISNVQSDSVFTHAIQATLSIDF